MQITIKTSKIIARIKIEAPLNKSNIENTLIIKNRAFLKIIGIKKEDNRRPQTLNIENK